MDFRRLLECFDFDRLSASCLEGLVLRPSKKKLFLVHWKIFQLVDPVQHQDVFSKDLLGEFCQLQPFQIEMYLLFPPKSPTEILKLTPQRWHASDLVGFAAIFGVREKFFRPTFIQLNFVTPLNRFREQCSLEDLELTCLEIHNCTAFFIFPPFDKFLL